MTFEADTEEAFEKYGKSVFAAAYSLCGSICDANDIMQDVFFKLHCGKKCFNDGEHLKRWLIRCAVNRAKNLMRRRKFIGDVPDNIEEIAVSDRVEYCPDIIRAMEKLPENQRIAVHLYYFEGYSAADIAAVTHRTEAAVKMSMSRARASLKNILGDDYRYDL